MLLTKEVLKAARALLGWTQQELADEAGLHHGTLSRFESEISMHEETIAKIAAAIKRGGIEFVIEDDQIIGVKKLKQPRSP
jgi:transcriptional regulator with XRE-family HTH domain